MKKTLISALILAFVLIMAFGTMTAAFTPYETYTYSINGDALASPPAYDAVYQINDVQMSTITCPVSIGTDSQIVDICTDSRGWIYLTDSRKNRVIALNQSYKAQYIIETFDSDRGRGDTFNEPAGLFCSDDYLYVCDTKNERIVMFNLADGTYHKTVNRPESEYFGDNYYFTPLACAADRYGRLFVICSSLNQGVVVMNEDSEFTGFIGAQKVTYSVFELFFRRFQSEEERENSVSLVSISLDNIALQHAQYGDFIYVVTTGVDAAKQEAAISSKDADYSPVKKLNAKGDEIMKRNGFFDCGGEVNTKQLTRSSAAKSGVSIVSDVAIGPEGSWSIIDEKRSKVFTYDAMGQLLFAFGDSSDQDQTGNIQKLTALDYQYDPEQDTYNLVLLDYLKSSFTVFCRNDYGDLLISALKNDNDRNYAASEEYWRKILEANNNFDTAYIGIGKALYNSGEYDEAMEYLAAAKETTVYAETLSAKNQATIVKYPILTLVIVAAAVLAIWLFVKLMGYAKKLNYAGNFKRTHTYWEELMYGFYVAFHPFDGFWDIKHENRGTVRGGLTILAINVVAFYYQVIGRSYLSNPTGQYSGFFVQVIAVFVPVILWAVSNWCLTTLFDGEATFKQVFVATCYALAPLPWFTVIGTLLTNMTNTGGGDLSGVVLGIGYVWVAFLLFFGTQVVQDYSMGKNVVTTLGTIVCMIVIMFVVILFANLVGDMVTFITNIITEIGYRT